MKSRFILGLLMLALFVSLATATSYNVNKWNQIKLRGSGVITQSFQSYPSLVYRADFNDDGVVNLDDYAIFAQQFGKTVTNRNQRYNLDDYDNKITRNDYWIFKAYFGRTC